MARSFFAALLVLSACAHRPAWDVKLTVHDDGSVEGTDGRTSWTAQYPVNGEQVWAGYDSKKWLPGVRFNSAERTTLRLKLEVPQGWSSAGTFDVVRPSPPFLFAWAAGRFTQTERVEDGHRFVALNGNDAVLAKTAAMSRFLESRTGVALPVATYTQVFVHGDAAQEAFGFALIGEEALTNPDAEWVLIHELAHQWFGVSLQCADFDDFWLNEGFATFFVAAWFEHTQGREAYEEEVAVWRARSDKVHAEGKDAPLSLAPPGKPRPHTDEKKLQARGVTYSRGALFLDRLRRELGDEAFWAVMRSYAATNAGKSVTSEALRAAIEAVTGRDWKDEFQRRVYVAAP